MFISENPVTNEIIKEYPFDNDLDSKLEQANLTYLKFSNFSILNRILLIEQLAKELDKNSEKLSSLISLEMGKPIKQSRAEVAKSIYLCKYYSLHAEKHLEPEIIIDNQLKAKVFYQPLGVLLGIMPWNFPVWQTLRFCIPAIISGNTIIIKPAPNVPQCAILLEEIFYKVFNNQKVFQLAFVETNTISELIKHPYIKGVTITGSAKAGASVASIAGSSIKKSVLELGGADPFVVCNDADIKKAAIHAIRSRMNNTGQTCIAAKRILVQKESYDKFKDLLKNEISALCIGDPMNEKTEISTLARRDLRENLQRQMESSISQGAKAIVQGGIMPGKGNYFQPALLENISSDMPVYNEEVFGPVAILLPFNTIDEALQISNDTEYGLGASIWTQNKEIQDYYSMKVEAGYVSVNNFTSSDPRLPFGGIKKSGYGRELGAEGLKEFTNIKTINYH